MCGPANRAQAESGIWNALLSMAPSARTPQRAPRTMALEDSPSDALEREKVRRLQAELKAGLGGGVAAKLLPALEEAVEEQGGVIQMLHMTLNSPRRSPDEVMGEKVEQPLVMWEVPTVQEEKCLVLANEEDEADEDDKIMEWLCSQPLRDVPVEPSRYLCFQLRTPSALAAVVYVISR